MEQQTGKFAENITIINTVTLIVKLSCLISYSRLGILVFLRDILFYLYASPARFQLFGYK